MLKSRLSEEARIALSRYSSDKAAQTLLPLWREFEGFLQSRGALPSSIADIPEASLRAYATFLDYRDCHIDDALVALSAVLLVCLHAGHNARILRFVVIPRIRRPIQNRQWDAFRLRTYRPLETAQLARNRKRRAEQDARASDQARNEDPIT